MKYIAYGSNMVNDQMKFRCPDSKLIGTGYIENARLEFFLHATVVRCSKDEANPTRVPVAVWEVSERDLHSLDRYEGYPEYYTRDIWTVTMKDGSQIKGIIYLMNMIRLSPPYTAYYDGIEDAYKKLGFSSEINTVLYPALMRSLFRHRSGIENMKVYAFQIEGSYYLIGTDDTNLYTVDPASLHIGMVSLPAEELSDPDVIQRFGWKLPENADIAACASQRGVYYGMNQLSMVS